jgi:hypothetical protein
MIRTRAALRSHWSGATLGTTLFRVEPAVKIGYNADMTKAGSISELDLLGSPLPGAVWLPHYRVGIAKRGAQEVLEWSVAQSFPPPRALGESPFVSLPRPLPQAMVKRVEQRRRDRSRGRNPNEKPTAEELMATLTEDPEELMAMFSEDPGIQMQLLPRLLSGKAPFYGGIGATRRLHFVSAKPIGNPGFRSELGAARYLPTSQTMDPFSLAKPPNVGAADLLPARRRG